MIDAADEKCLTAYKTLCSELSSYSEELAEKPRLVLCNKIDVEGAKAKADEIAAEIHKDEPDTPVIPVSILMNYGMNNARNEIMRLVDVLEEDDAAGTIFEKKLADAASAFMAERESIDDDAEVQYPGSER